MNCPNCNHLDTRVTNSRPSTGGGMIRRVHGSGKIVHPGLALHLELGSRQADPFNAPLQNARQLPTGGKQRELDGR